MKLAEVFPDEDGIRIIIPNLPPIPIFYQWLRDHCRCAECYNEFTNQRKLSILDFPPDVHPEEFDLSDGVLNVTWHGGHLSKWELSWLVKNARFLGEDPARKIEKTPWLKLPEIARVDVKTYMSTDAGLVEVLSSLLRYGISMVTGVEATSAATEKVITRIAPVQKTLFGEMWLINVGEDGEDNNVEEELHKDTAYSNSALGAHTDNTYWHDAAGLHTFHCLTPSAIGGVTLLVDGLNVSLRVKNNHPESYERLTRMPVSATYKEADQNHTHVDPILKLDLVTKDFLQIRFNAYDRSVLRTLPQTEIQQHYEDLRLIASIVADKNGENHIKLLPGEVLFIDNWRVLHGRTAYSGPRCLTGGYVARTDWLSKAAVLGLIDD